MNNDKLRGGLYMDADGNFYNDAAKRAYQEQHGGLPERLSGRYNLDGPSE